MSELLGANTDTLERVAGSLSADARRVQDIRALAGTAVAELQASWSGPDLMLLSQQWEQCGSSQLAVAAASLDSCAAQLRAQSTSQQEASSADGGRGLLPIGATGFGLGGFGLLAPPPSAPSDASPADNATWWRSLNTVEQLRVIQDHPDWIGNRDGIPFGARDQANRSLLVIDGAALLVEKKRLEHNLADTWLGGTFNNDDARLDHVNDKLASLAAIEQTLRKIGERQLMVLDVGPERVEAAIAFGNVDTADNVAVFVPGLDSTVSGRMVSVDKNMEQLQQRTELESRRAGSDQSAATVTWIGYQAPQSGISNLIGDASLLDDQAAVLGAAQLVPLLLGIGAARDHDAHLTLLGHSYGSTTAGVALQQETGVDDAVFFGSPGLGTSHLDDLLVPGGHTYYIEARDDVVGDLGYFGTDPSHLAGIEHASARDSAVLDPLNGEVRHFHEVTGHSAYLEEQSTSQYNMSVVAAGLPDRRVHDQGEGIGDVLSWPMPRTYR